MLRDGSSVLHHLAGIGERAHRVIADGIDLRGRRRPAIGIHEIIFSGSFEDKGRFAVTFGQNGVLARRRQRNWLPLRIEKRNGVEIASQFGEGRTELHNLRFAAAEIQIGLAIVVLKHGGINRLRSRVRQRRVVNQRFPDGILERPLRAVAHRNADLRAIHRQEEVILAV